jgi:hypothetical protein
MVEMLSRTSNLLQSISRWLPTEVIRKRAWIIGAQWINR